jgi:glycosyltransferase involved in cell wall biosynthesis
MSVRGFYRAYINTVALIDAIPQVLQSEPRAIFIVDGKDRLNSGAHLYLERRARRLRVAHRVRFTSLTRRELFITLRAADVIVSSVLYDGLPISMLEGMAAGLIPVYSNQSPILEYIHPGVNGFVIDPRDPRDIAVQLIRAVRVGEQRADVVAYNAQLLAQKADRATNLGRIDALYAALGHP